MIVAVVAAAFDSVSLLDRLQWAVILVFVSIQEAFETGVVTLIVDDDVVVVVDVAVKYRERKRQAMHS